MYLRLDPCDDLPSDHRKSLQKRFGDRHRIRLITPHLVHFGTSSLRSTETFIASSQNIIYITSTLFSDTAFIAQAPTSLT